MHGGVLPGLAGPSPPLPGDPQQPPPRPSHRSAALSYSMQGRHVTATLQNGCGGKGFMNSKSQINTGLKNQSNDCGGAGRLGLWSLGRL